MATVQLQVESWVEFEYTNQGGERKTYRGEVREAHVWGYKLMTADGWRSFRGGQIENVRPYAQPVA